VVKFVWAALCAAAVSGAAMSGPAFAGETMPIAYKKDPIGLDMFNMPSYKPQENPITYPTDTIPTRGKEMPLDRDTAEQQLANPVSTSPESVAMGRRTFAKYCVACHGVDAKGATPVAEKLSANGAPLWDITLTIPGRKDGFIYGTIRNGGINMPSYGPQTTVAERWALVNFLRSLTQQ
jgi:mono/diheme cytochrome c family protein